MMLDLDYTDTEWSETENRLHSVSSGVAGRAFNDLCKMIGGRWPDCRMQEEAPEAFAFFMALLSGS